MNSTVMEVRRTDPADLRIVHEDIPSELTSGQVLLEVDRFALTANNITYREMGDRLGYWQFFPTNDDVWGRVPAMSYATVIASAHGSISEGERVWGFVPMGTHLLIQAGDPIGRGFRDISPHRDSLAPSYADFQRTTSDPIYDADREEQDVLLKGLFITSWLCEDALYDNAFYGAEDCLITSASSKTAIALGFANKERGRLRSIALTSARNRDFCQRVGCYDEVITYDEISRLSSKRNAVLIDMAGDSAVNAAIHTQVRERLKHDSRLGATHRSAAPTTHLDSLPGAKPQGFFAPYQIEKRRKDWGRDELEARMIAAFERFRVYADEWLKIRRFDGEAESMKAFTSVFSGVALPEEGYTVSLAEL